jgi:hypothetical protein
MEIEFIKQEQNPNKYLVFEKDKLLFYATYEKKTESKFIFTPNKELLVKGFPFNSKTIQVIPDYCIKLLGNNPEEIIISNKSFFFQVKKFFFRNEEYRIVQHFGTSFSIFKGKKQVAAYKTHCFNSSNNHMHLYCDDNLPIDLFCLISLYLYSDFGSEGALPSYPFNLWFQVKKFDKNWVPNS